jgi:hypothetical protein
MHLDVAPMRTRPDREKLQTDAHNMLSYAGLASRQSVERARRGRGLARDVLISLSHNRMPRTDGL